ncbi:MAG: phosphate ABC transporter substrate-binding protein [Nitrospirae bacterium]|nr:MAG: phosphate ABC transporter substrate-binding protein [Nitrospirota bacterium]
MTVATVLATSQIGCQESSVGHEREAKLVITGSSTVAPLLLEMGKRFEQQHPFVQIDVQTGGSSRGIADTRTGLADIGMVSRTLGPKERDLYPVPIARDGIGVIVHRTNPVSGLSDEQLAGIYTGRLTNWQAVGGRNAPIVVVHKAEGRATLDLFLAYTHLSNSAVHADVVIGDNEQGIKVVAGNPQAIGYVSIGTAEYHIAHGVPIKLLALNGIKASLSTVQDGTYPLARSLVLVTKTKPQGLVKQFLEFVRSPEVQDLVERHHFVSLES